MKLEHLTFAQLYRLSQPECLMRVTLAYHRALRREWNDIGLQAAPGEYQVSTAERYFPYIKNRYTPVLNLLTNGALKIALRDAADRESVIPTPGAAFPFMMISRFKFPQHEARVALATLILKHCKANGVAGKFRVGPLGDIAIRIETTASGCVRLMHKRGLQWGSILEFCAEARTAVWLAFPWVPILTDESVRVNPCVWPCNTPDVNEIAKELICLNS